MNDPDYAQTNQLQEDNSQQAQNTRAHKQALELQQELNKTMDGNEETEESLAFKSSCFYLIYSIIIISLISSFVYLIRTNRTDRSRVASVFDSVSTLMNKNPIAELFIIIGKCPNDYETIELGGWPGTIHGCYYPELDEVQPAVCSNPHYDGIGVKSVDPEQIFTWRTFKFCARRYSEVQKTFNETCKKDFKLCGNYLCIPKSELCPVTSIQIFDENPATNSSELEIIHTQSKTKYAVITRNPKKEPLVTFHLSVEGKPCLDLDAGTLREIRYPLLDAINGCAYGENEESIVVDSRQLIDQITELDLRDDILGLPMYNESVEGQSVYLYGIERLRVRQKPECMNTESFTMMGTISSTMEELDFNKNIFYLVVFFGTFAILLLSLEVRQSDSGKSDIDFQMRSYGGLILATLCTVLFVFSVYCFMSSYSNLEEIQDFRDEIEVFQKRFCFYNDNVTIALNDFVKSIPYAIGFFYMLIVIMGLLFIPVLMFALEYLQRDKDILPQQDGAQRFVDEGRDNL